MELGECRKECQLSHADDVSCLTMTPDCKWLITGSRDCSLKMWQIDNCKLVQVMVGHTAHVTAVVASHVSTIVGSGSGLPQASSSVKNSAAAIAATASGNGQQASRQLSIISGSADSCLIAWDPATGTEIFTFRGHRASVSCLRVSTDGSVLVSGDIHY